jgi:hypothetical protein
MLNYRSMFDDRKSPNLPERVPSRNGRNTIARLHGSHEVSQNAGSSDQRQAPTSTRWQARPSRARELSQKRLKEGSILVMSYRTVMAVFVLVELWNRECFFVDPGPVAITWKKGTRVATRPHSTLTSRSLRVQHCTSSTRQARALTAMATKLRSTQSRKTTRTTKAPTKTLTPDSLADALKTNLNITGSKKATKAIEVPLSASDFMKRANNASAKLSSLVRGDRKSESDTVVESLAETCLDAFKALRKLRTKPLDVERSALSAIAKLVALGKVGIRI